MSHTRSLNRLDDGIEKEARFLASSTYLYLYLGDPHECLVMARDGVECVRTSDGHGPRRLLVPQP